VRWLPGVAAFVATNFNPPRRATGSIQAGLQSGERNGEV
jgi:hypothetical protein